MERLPWASTVQAFVTIIRPLSAKISTAIAQVPCRASARLDRGVVSSLDERDRQSCRALIAGRFTSAAVDRACRQLVCCPDCAEAQVFAGLCVSGACAGFGVSDAIAGE